MDLTRKEVIETLENVKEKRQLNNKRELDSLDYAISSLKTDEAYQIMYEGGEIFTKADMVAILTEIQMEIEEIEIGNNVPSGFEPVSKTSAFYEGVSASSKVIQQKIDALKENK